MSPDEKAPEPSSGDGGSCPVRPIVSRPVATRRITIIGTGRAGGALALSLLGAGSAWRCGVVSRRGSGPERTESLGIPWLGTSDAPGAARTPTPLNSTDADAIERRLDTIKRLRDKGAITPEEYQQKRKEILQHL